MAAVKEIHSDLMVIGAGMTGMAAGLFAARRGIATVQVGVTGQIGFASGLLDLMGVHPVNTRRHRADPWRAIQRLVCDEPGHPYALLAIDQIRTAMDTFLVFLNQAGLPYRALKRRNAALITSAGTIKTTYGVPAAMQAGVKALTDRKPALLVDFQGLKGYSARQIIETLGPAWPGLRSVRLAFPDTGGELYAEHTARWLDVEQNRRWLGQAIAPHMKNAQAVGLPPLLGIYQTQAVVKDLQTALGVPVFEIPAMVPSVPGLRLREAFEDRMPQLGVRTYYQKKVLHTRVLPSGDFLFTVGAQEPELRIRTRSAIVASGRFFGKGLRADRARIRETIFDLPVAQPEERTQWHRKDLLHPAGHLINRAGLIVDPRFRPLDTNGEVIHERLHAAGSILAHQDWTRQKCGSGLAVATAYGAVEAIQNSSR